MNTNNKKKPITNEVLTEKEQQNWQKKWEKDNKTWLAFEKKFINPKSDYLGSPDCFKLKGYEFMLTMEKFAKKTQRYYSRTLR